MCSFYQPFARSIAVGLLGAIGAGALSAEPLFAQSDPVENTADEISPFCESLAGVSPWLASPNLDPLRAAIALGGDLNQLCDYYGEQVLPLNFWLATDAAIAQQLIEMGADVNGRDGKGNTPLHAVGESVENARSLLERGANPNAQNSSGLTPLHAVSGEKSTAVMALLIEKGADVTATSPEGFTPLHFSYQSPTGELAALLVSKGADVNARTSDGRTPLHYALSFPELVAQLLQSGADPNIQNRDGAAIHTATLTSVVQLLLEAGADVNARNPVGQTALHTQRYSAEVTAFLLAAGANVNIRDNQGRTPLFDVNVEVAQQLLAAGADLNIQDELGRAPLHQAVIEERSYFGPELVALFLGEGAIADIEDYQGETALDIALRLEKTNIAALFPSDGATLVGTETTDVEATDPQQLINIQRQVKDLLQSARADSQSVKAALSQLSQAAELTQTVSDVEKRDRLLYEIGFVLVDLDALEKAEAIAKTMNYETREYRTGGQLRLWIEQTLVKAYVRTDRMSQAQLVAENSPPNVSHLYWTAMAEALVEQNLLLEGTALLDRISESASGSADYQRQSVISQINQAYIGAEQFEAAQAFLQQQSFSLSGYETQELQKIALWAGRSGQLAQARAIADQIPENYRAGTLLDLARLHQYQNQPAQASALLDELQQLLADGHWPSNYLPDRFALTAEVAIAYAELGDLETARQVLLAAEQENSTLAESVYLTSERVSAFAKIGAFDRAMALLDKTSAGQRHEARLSLASVYVDRRQYDPAITILSQIPSSALAPYLEEQQDLFNRIAEESLAQENVRTAKRVAQVIENPLDSVPVWVKIASFYQEQQQPEAAISVLDETLAAVKPLEKLNSPADRNADYEVSNAGLLIAIAKGYWAAGQTDRAVETAEAAIASVQNFQSDSQSRWYGNNDLEAIAKLGLDWQILELQSAAVREIESRLDAATADERDFSNQYYQLASLARLAYDPDQPDSDVLNRSLAKLEEILEQTPDIRRLSVLHNLAALYSEVGRLEKARATIEEMLTLIAPLSAEAQSRNYARLAAITLKNAEIEASLQMLPRLSSAQQIELLTDLVRQFAQADDTEQTIRYFEQLVELGERSLSQGDLDRLLLDLSYELSGLVSEETYSQKPRTPAQVALMMRLPQHISDARSRSVAWISFAPNLPPAEAAQAYKALSATLKAQPASYNKRAFLWVWIEKALSHGAFEQATQIAYGLDGDYCRAALSWIEIEKQRSDRSF